MDTKIYPSAADAELARLMRVYGAQGHAVAQDQAADALAEDRIGCGDYLWLVRWTEGRVA